MRVIARMGDRGISEEAIVEERSFEDEVDEGVKKVPYEQDAKLGRCRGVQEADRGKICDYEEGESCEKTTDGIAVNHKSGLSFHIDNKNFSYLEC